MPTAQFQLVSPPLPGHGRVALGGPVLTAGIRFGPYDVRGQAGRGGMGEVYQAHDGKLNRDVALKVLPDAFAADPDRLARFAREAQVLAALSHPHIAAIHGLEECGGRQALVLEFVEGPTLAERIAMGPLLLRDALAIAIQMADALAAAHRKGIIHRDLKPGNVKVTASGQVKVLDFGLAKTTAAEPCPTCTRPAYLWRRHARWRGPRIGRLYEPGAGGRVASGRPHRIRAFGCVLFEMLTGRRAFVAAGRRPAPGTRLEAGPEWHLCRPRQHLGMCANCCETPARRPIDRGGCRQSTMPASSSSGTPRRRRGAAARSSRDSPRPPWRLVASTCVPSASAHRWSTPRRGFS